MSTLFQSWIYFARAHPELQQFGQRDDEYTFNGATGCTHTVLQRLVLAKTGKYYSHDEISKIATYPYRPSNRRGLRSGGLDDEAGRVIAKFKLPYRIVFGASYSSWRPLLPGASKQLGPVMVAILYGWWPEDRGYRYGRYVADGRPNGYASIGGKTQLVGAEGVYHATLAIGARKKPHTTNTFYAYVNEPNHGSASRPEKPAYDRITTGQLKRAYDKYTYKGRKNLVWIPTDTFRPKGF